MRLSRRTNTIILWVISLGLLLGMIITFTPTLGGNLFGNRGANDPSQQGPNALLVNGEPISQLEVTRQRQQNHTFSAIQEGEAAADLDLLVLDALIEQEVLRQAAAPIRVSGGDVRAAVNDFREAQGVAGSRNDDAYLRLIGSIGLDDQGFRAVIADQLRQQRFQEGIIEAVEVSDAEVEAFYALNEQRYQSEERILARMIVVDDEELAAELRERAEAGEDFAALATEHSLERADRSGALGAPAGSSDPQPVGRAALPVSVSSAAFALRGPGLTEVIENAGRYYLVSVEELRGSTTRPFAEVQNQVRQDALAAKQQQVLEAEIERLREQAVVTVPEESLTVYNDEPVARVGDVEITASELVRATYTNQQIQQALSPQNALLITEFFKPTFLDNLIDLELAYQGAQELDATFIGSRDQVAQAALAYVTRDAEASEEAIDSYYQENLALYTVPASAEVTEASFGDAESAAAFRSAVLAGADPEGAAEAVGGVVEDLGTVGPGVLAEGVLDAALFATEAFEPLPDSDLEISDVLVILPPEIEPADAPAEEIPAEDTPAEDTPAEDTPVEDTPAEDAPVADTPTDDTQEDTPAGDTGDPADSPETDGAAADPGEDGAAATDEGTATEGAAAEDAAADPAEAVAEERYVVLIAQRTPERIRPLDEVRAEVERAVLAAERTELRNAWLDDLRERIPVENLLAAVEEPGDEGTGDIPADEAPAEDTPSEDAPPEDPPAEDTPADDTPAEDTPDDTPADDAPAEDPPAEDAPADN